MSEPKRPPPPKSYVPLLLLEGPVPELPPRPAIDGDEEVSKDSTPALLPSASSPQPDSNIKDDGGRTLGDSNSSAANHAPMPQTRTTPSTNEQVVQVSQDRSESPGAVKPEKKNTKRTPPAPPAPYAKGKGSQAPQPRPNAPPRRHTVSTTGPRPRKPPDPVSSNQKQDPPDLLGGDYIYATVNKPKRYPPPSVPAPPPPYEGDTVQNLDSPQNGPPPGTDTAAILIPTPVPVERSPSSSPTPPKNVSSTAADDHTPSNKPTAKPHDGPSGKGQPRPLRPVPSRPSRPPAASPQPTQLMSDVAKPLKRSATIGAVQSPRLKKRKNGAKPEISIVGAQPMTSDVIPSPTLPKAPSRPAGGPNAAPRKHPQDSTIASTSALESDTTNSPSDSAPPAKKQPPSDSESKQPLQRRPPKRPEAAVKASGPTPPRPGPPLARKVPPPHPVSRPSRQPSMKKEVEELGPPPDEEPPEPPSEEMEEDEQTAIAKETPSADTDETVSSKSTTVEEKEKKTRTIPPPQRPRPSCPPMHPVAKKRPKTAEAIPGSQPNTKEEEQPKGEVDKPTSPTSERSVPIKRAVSPTSEDKPLTERIAETEVTKQVQETQNQTKVDHQPPKRPHPVRRPPPITKRVSKEAVMDTEKEQVKPTEEAVTKPKEAPKRPLPARRPAPPRTKSKTETKEPQHVKDDDESAKDVETEASKPKIIEEMPVLEPAQPLDGEKVTIDTADKSEKAAELENKEPVPKRPQPMKRPPPPSKRPSRKNLHTAEEVAATNDKLTSNETVVQENTNKKEEEVKMPIEEPSLLKQDTKESDPKTDDKLSSDQETESQEDTVKKNEPTKESSESEHPTPKKRPTTKRPPPPRVRKVPHHEVDTKQTPAQEENVPLEENSLEASSTTETNTPTKGSTAPKHPPAAVKRPPPPAAVKRPPPPAARRTVHKKEPVATPMHVSQQESEAKTAEVDDTSKAVEKEENIQLPKRPQLVKRPPPQRKAATVQESEKETDETGSTKTVASEESAAHPPKRPQPAKRPPPPSTTSKSATKKEAETQKQDAEDVVIIPSAAPRLQSPQPSVEETTEPEETPTETKTTVEVAPRTNIPKKASSPPPLAAASKKTKPAAPAEGKTDQKETGVETQAPSPEQQQLPNDASTTKEDITVSSDANLVPVEQTPPTEQLIVVEETKEEGLESCEETSSATIESLSETVAQPTHQETSLKLTTPTGTDAGGRRSPSSTSPSVGRRSPNTGRLSPSVRRSQAEGEDEGVMVIRYSSTKRKGSQSASSGSSAESSPMTSVKLRDKSRSKPSRPVSMPPNRPPGSPGLKGRKQVSFVEPPPPPSRPYPPPPSHAPPQPPSRPPPSRPKPTKPPIAAKPPPLKPAAPSKPPAPSRPTAPSRPLAPSKPPAPNKPPAGPSKPPAPSKPAAPSKPPAPSKPVAPTRTAVPHRKDLSQPPTLPPRPAPGHPLYSYVCTEPHGIAKVHHDATDIDELSYMDGDVIELIEKIDDHWYYARNTDLELQEGLVLASSLHIVKRLPGQDTVAGFEDGPCAVATHEFVGQSMDELSFKAGELIMLKTRVGENWLRGKLINGKQGIFPKNFVEIVEELPADAYEEPQQTTTAQSTVEIRDPHCVALFPFEAGGPDELPFVTGDTILLVEKVGDEWLKGRLGSKEGMFPANFVEVKIELPPLSVPKTTMATARGGQVATALYDFDGQEGELTFKAGDKIKITSRVNEEWVKGELQGKTGMFPTSFVDKVPDNLPQEKEESTSTKKEDTKPKTTQPLVQETGTCEALFDFEGEGIGELSFKTGDIITILSKLNDEWLNGKIGTSEGIFPAGFVKITKELPVQKASSSASVSKTTKWSDDLMPRGVVLFDFTAGSSEEISLKEGDVVYLLSKNGDEWYTGENTRTSDIGDFPANFVNVQVPLP